jgi:hypothetical protein
MCLCLLLRIPAFADNKEFADGEAQGYLSTVHPVCMLDNGNCFHSACIGNDGKMLVFTYYTIDITNPYMKCVTGLPDKPVIRPVKAPDGWKCFPVLLGAPSGQGESRILFCVCTPKKGAHGIYRMDLTNDKGFTLWQAGGYTGLAADYNETFLAYIKDPDPRRPKRELWIQPLDRNAGKKGLPYRVASELKGVIAAPVFSRDGLRIYFTYLTYDATSTAVEGTYVVENRGGAKALPLDRYFSATSLVYTIGGEPVSFDLLAGEESVDMEGVRAATGRIVLFRPGNKDRRVAIDDLGASAGGAVCSPNNDTIYFSVNRIKKDEFKQGIFFTKIDPGAVP